MHQFFVDDCQIGKEYVTITGNDVKHISSVLRMHPGETIRISTNSGRNYLCEITEIGRLFVQADIIEDSIPDTELSIPVTLFQALPKGDRMETVIEKAVELGVDAIVPVEMKFCVVKLDDKKKSNKVKRWQAIAESAAKQSKRSKIPIVHTPISFKKAAEQSREFGLFFVPYENEVGMDGTKKGISKVRSTNSVGIMIGPEGGFTPEEIACMRKMEQVEVISLGKRILRTDTAAITAMSLLMLEIEQME